MYARTSGRANAGRRAIYFTAAAVLAFAVGQSTVAAATHAHVRQQPLTAALAAQLSKNVNDHVIVILKSQPAAAAAGSHAATLRSAAIASAQASFMSELRAVHATRIKSYSLVDSFAATVSAGEAARLKANGAVAAVIPDVTIRGAQPARAALTSRSVSSALTPHHPRRVWQERQGPARPRGARADKHRVGQPSPADRAVAGHHRRGRQGRLDRRRHRPPERELHPRQWQVGFDHSRAGTIRTSPETGRASRPPAARRSSTPTPSPGRACTSTTCRTSRPSPTRRRATSASRASRPARAWSG